MTGLFLKTATERGENVIKIGFFDGSSLSLKPCYLSGYCENPVFWEEGREISPLEESALRFAAACYRAERAGMRLVGRAEQTSTGLARKLERRGYDSDCVSAVIARFLDLDLVNNGRYAERWLRSRLARKGGKVPSPRRLSADLANRGIERDTAASSLKETLDIETEWTLLQRFIAQNFPDGNSEGFSLRGRLRFEGFSSSVLQRWFED
jgi:regulatory protein